VEVSTSEIPVRPTLRNVLKYILIAVAALVVVGAILPFISVGRFGRPIQQALETALGRRVEVGQVRCTLFSGPGFSIDDVVIHEDPRYGIEPCAYVTSLKARVRLDKLLLGKFEFAGLRLVEPTLNVVKRSDGTWNIVQLIDRLSTSNVAPVAFLPAIEASDARINFKSGNRKSIFYIDNSDIAVYAESSGKLRIQFAGSPSRSDRLAGGFGSFHGSANWYLRPRGPEGTQLEADLLLDQSNLSELITLVQGHDIGVHGEVRSHAMISGPATALKITGDLHVDDVHRWDLLPSSGESWQVRYTGNLDLVRHNFSLQTTSGDQQPTPPVSLTVHVNDFQTEASWAVVAQLSKAPAQNVLPFARRMGVSISDGLNLVGTLDGAVGYSSHNGWNGGLAFSNITASLPDMPPLEARTATASILKDHIHFDPALVQAGVGGQLRVSGDYFPDTRKVVANVTAEETRIDILNKAVSAWLGTVPLLGRFTKGQVSGTVAYQHQLPDEPRWSGQIQISQASLQAPELGLPLNQFAAHASFTTRQADVSRFTGRLGALAVEGDYHYNASRSPMERLHLQTPSADIAQLDKALQPVLAPQGFLARLRFGKRTLPAFIADRDLDGDLVIGKLSVNGFPLGSLRGKFAWQGPDLQFTALSVQFGSGAVEGTGGISLASNSPKYRFTGSVASYPWKGGALSAEGRLATSGIGSDLFSNLRVSGSFDGENLSVSPDVEFNTLAGSYELRFDAGWPQLTFTNVRGGQADEVWQGSGRTERDGSLLLDLVSGTKEMHVVSTLDPNPADAAPVASNARE
jgi:AsmA protein